MPYSTITERYGSLSATGIAKETTFGTRPAVARERARSQSDRQAAR